MMIFTEGWQLYRPDPSLSRTIDDRSPLPDPLRVDPDTGRLRPQGAPDPNSGVAMSTNVCDQMRMRLSQVDHEREFLSLLQRANRANVSFYPVDARGLMVFDQPTNFNIAPTQDQAGLRHRRDFLRDMAAQTDGQALLDNSNLSRDMQKVFRDLGSYYLLSYYSTNTRLDGRFRRLRVEVKRDGLSVRARPGYLAPTEAEARGVGAAIDRTAAAAGTPPPTVTRALDALAPARGNLPARVQAVGARRSIRAIVELDAATAKQPEWMSGGTLRLSVAPEKADERRRRRRVANARRRRRTRPAQHRRQRHRSAAASRPIHRPRGVDGAQRAAAAAGHDPCDRAGGERRGWHRRAGVEARAEHGARLRRHGRSAFPPHRASAHRGSACGGRVRGHRTDTDADRPAHAAGRLI